MSNGDSLIDTQVPGEITRSRKGIRKVLLHFLLFLNDEMTQVDEILPNAREGAIIFGGQY